MNSPTTHPSSSELNAFASRRLTTTEMRSVEAHVAACSPCYKIVQTLRQRQQIISTPSPAAAGTDDDPSRRGVVPPPFSLEEVPEFLRDHPRYQIVRKLGAGGMGVVFQARPKVMDREVAIKLMAAKYQDHQQAIERFYREIKTVARLDHPNICRAFDAEQSDDIQMLVMEYVDGRDLEKIVRKKGPLPIAHACHYIRQACRGLQHAHEQGMVHRDLKPSNLMLTKTGYIKVLDFGLARFVSEQQQQNGNLTQQDGPMGTPCYLSPEQAMRPAGADIRSDIYSLGCTLYHLLAGRPPFLGETKFQVITAHYSEPPPVIHQYRAEVPSDLWRIIRRMLAKDPNERPQTPDELADLMGPFVKTGSRGPDSGSKRSRERESIPMLEIVSEPEDLLEAEIVTDEPTPMRNFPRATPMGAPPPLPVLPVLPVLPDLPRQRSSRPRIDFDADPPEPSRPSRRPARAVEPVPASGVGIVSRLFAVLIGLLFVAGVGAIAWYSGIVEPLIDKKVPVRQGTARKVSDTVNHSPGSYRVRFPGQEKVRTESDNLTIAKTSPKETVSVYETGKGLTLSVGESTLTPALRSKERSRIEEYLVENGLPRSDSKPTWVINESDQLRGLEWTGTMPGTFKQTVHVRARLFVVENQVYRLFAKSSDREQLNDSLVEAFFDSFAVVSSKKKN